MMPEAPGLVTEAVDLSPLRSPVPSTWVRPIRDAIVAPDKQLRYAQNVGQHDLIDLDAGHMCMISRPEELGAILNGIAGSI
jgi:pimeloyl-ACP methyl ester carboxylesterase